MERKYLDCRDIPSENGCSLTIAGTEEEVLRVATRHAIEDHREMNSPQLTESLRRAMKSEGEEPRMSTSEGSKSTPAGIH